MSLNLSKDGGILSKDSFGASHPLGHGSLCSNKGLGCNLKIVDNSHDGKKILSSDVGEDDLRPVGAIGAGDEECVVGTGGAGIGSEVGDADIVMWG